MSSGRAFPFPPLRFAIPVALLLIAVVANGVALWHGAKGVEELTRQRRRAALIERMNELRGSLEYVLRARDIAMANELIYELTTDPHVISAYLLDDSDTVIASTQLAARGMKAADVLADLGPLGSKLAERARQTLGQQTGLSPSGDELVGVFPVSMPAKGESLRASTQGLLVVRRDLKAERAMNRQIIGRAVLLYSLLLGVLAALLGVFFHFVLTRRVGRLVDAASRIASGDLTAAANVAGFDEIGAVGLAFDSMARQLEQQMQARAESDQLLRRSEELYRTLVEQAWEAIFIADPEGRCEDANPSGCALLGYSRDELLNLTLKDIIAPEDIERLPIDLDGMRAGKILVHERIFVRKDGGRVSVELSGRMLPNGQFLGVARDIRERKEAEKIRVHLQLADRLASIGTLAAGVAHEINNPLAYVVSSIEHANQVLAPKVADAALRTELQQALQDAGEGVDRVRRIVKDLKAFSRSDEEKLGVVDLHANLDLAASMASSIIRHRSRLVKKYGAVPPVLGSEGRLGQVFLNLLVNAAQAMPEQRSPDQNEIRIVTTTDAQGRACVEVEDNGMGIAPELLGKIFDPFFTTKPVGVGTGMGLSISRSIVASHGGEISVESQAGVGTAFRVVLPAMRVGEVIPAAEAPFAFAMAKLSILVIDDEPQIGKTLRRVLQPHDVVVTANGEEGIDACRHRHFDVVLCDMTMPGLSGREVYDIIEKQLPGLERRVIFITGGALSAPSREFLESVKNPVLEKPFESADLLAVLRDLTGRETDRSKSAPVR